MHADLSGKSLCSSLRVLSALRGETTVQRMAKTPAIRCGAAVGDSLWREPQVMMPLNASSCGAATYGVGSSNVAPPEL